MFALRTELSVADKKVPSHDSPNEWVADTVTCVRFAVIPPEDGDPSGRRVPIELVLCGCNNGLVVAHSVGPASPLPPTRSGRVCATAPAACLHKHTDAVSAMAVLGTVAASCGEDGTVRISFLYPVLGAEAAVVRVPHTPIRSVLLWEGQPAWASCPGEDAALYVFGGCDDGAVRLWRVDVLTHAVTVWAVFVVSHTPDVARSYVRDSRAFRARLHCLALDGGDRLLAGAEGCFACWSLEALPVPGAAVAEGVYASHWLDAMVFAREAPAVRALCEGHGCQWRDRHSVVCGGAEIGVVTDTVTAVMEADDVRATAPCGDTKTVAVHFASLKAAVRWPVSAFDIARAPALVGRADQRGAVFALAVLRGGRFVSGGADAHLRLWQWHASDALYHKLLEVPAHRDLIRHVAVLRSPDVFVSGSYDGTLSEWHVFDEPKMCMLRGPVVGLRVHDGAPASSAESPPVSGVKLGAAAMDVFPAARAVLVAGLFEASVRTFERVAVDTCELPPGWYFDGCRSVRAAPDDDAHWFDAGEPVEPEEGTLL